MTNKTNSDQGQYYLPRLLGVAAVIIILFFGASSSYAQGFGQIGGTITDPTGAAIPSAQITAKQIATGATSTTVTNGDGGYVLPSLPPAVYDITVTANGFSSAIEKNVTLQADGAVNVSLQLKIGASSDTITVTSEAPQVDTTTGTLAQVVDEKRVNELPLNGRNAAALTTLVAGVVVAPNGGADQGNTKTFPVVVGVTVNGVRSNQSNYLLDGGNNVDEYTNVNAPFPFPDALQEFSVQTSNYSAEYGQNAGAVVNVVTKSGGNKFHGDLFEYVRNAVFNAANYFAYLQDPVSKAQIKTVDPLKRNQFGGTIGGPVSIPHLFHSDRSFFFFGFQKTISRDQTFSATSATLPTAAQLNGDFTATKSQVINPFTQMPYVGNRIPTSAFNQSSLAVLKDLPQVTGAYAFRKPVNQDFNEYVARFDQELGQKDRFFARYYYNKFSLAGVLDPKNLLTYTDGANITYQNAVISETHTFSSKILNNFILSYQREGATRGPLPGSPNVNDFGVNIWQPAFNQINAITVTGLFTIGDNPQGVFARNNYTLNDDVHVTAGNHALSFGGHIELSKIDINNQFQQPGAFVFNGSTSGASNDPTANFLLGYLATFNQASGQFFNDRGKFIGFYAQDSWKATPRLTLNYGIRYEPFFPWHEMQGRAGQFNPSAYAAGTISQIFPNAPPGLLFPGDPGVPRDGIRPVFTSFMPRIGFAYDVFGDGKTSVRGGFGSFYDTRPSAVTNNGFTSSSPFVTSVALNYPSGGFSNPYQGTANPFPAAQPPGKNSTFQTQPYNVFDPSGNYQVPVYYGWNLALERQLKPALFARLAYVGSHGSHQLVPLDINPVYNGFDSPGKPTGQRVYGAISNPNTGSGGIVTGKPVQSSFAGNSIAEESMTGNSIYHSLQASLEQRFRNGVTVLANYTWSKALDDLPVNVAVTAASGNSYVLPVYAPNYKRLDYGPSDFDHRHVMSLSYVWQFPAVHEGPGFVRYIINGWQTAGLLQYRSGDALTIVSGVNNSGTQLGRDRALQVGSAYGPGACTADKYNIALPCKDFLSPGSFVNNPVGTYGNVSKGSVQGPQYVDWDANLARYFKMTESAQFQFRAEYFNLLNHTNFLDPNVTTNNNSNFGLITGANDPRIAQLSLKLLF